MEGGSGKRSKADAVAIVVNLVRSIAIDETDVSFKTHKHFYFFQN
jgi:hypothetical protein